MSIGYCKKIFVVRRKGVWDKGLFAGDARRVGVEQKQEQGYGLGKNDLKAVR